MDKNEDVKKSGKESKGQSAKGAKRKTPKKWEEKELELQKSIEAEKERVRKLELKMQEEEKKYREMEQRLQDELKEEREKTRKLEAERIEEREKQEARERELQESIDEETTRAKQMERQLYVQTEDQKAGEQELQKQIEDEKRRAKTLELRRKEDAERHKETEIELLRGIEEEKQKFKDLEFKIKEDAEKHKTRKIGLQKALEDEKQEIRNLDLLIREEVEREKTRELELQREIEEEEEKTKSLELQRANEAEKQRARELELQESINAEKVKTAELELKRKKEDAERRAREKELQKGIEQERRKAHHLEKARKREVIRRRTRELKLRKIKKKEEARRTEAEKRLLEGISRKGIGLEKGASRLLIALIVLVTVIVFSKMNRPSEYSRTIPIMGTFMEIKTNASGVVRGDLSGKIDRALKYGRELEKKFSIYNPESEINKLNIDKMRVVSIELFNLINKAKRLSYITGGTFDITIAPVLKAKGFYKDMPGEIRDMIPDDTKGVGIKNVTLRLDNSVRLRNGAWIDLSGIAKGDIVDSMVNKLKEEGVNDILINAGGDLYCGVKNGNQPWMVGVREPGSEEIVLTLAVKNMAVATSGDYENIVLDKATGEVLSHIVDPFKMAPMEKVLSSVTVIAPTCSEADALATGMMVMEEEDAIALANEMQEVSIIVIRGSGNERSIKMSEGASNYVVGR